MASASRSVVSLPLPFPIRAWPTGFLYERVLNVMLDRSQTHPKVDKKLFDQESILGLKDGSKPFPSTRVAVLRWSVKSQDDSLLPLNLTCWPDKEGSDKLNVTIEYEMQREMVLDNVNILIPLGSHDAPHVASIDGVYQHNAAEGKLLWHQDRVDASYVKTLRAMKRWGAGCGWVRPC